MLNVNLFDPAVRDNPFPTYARMREESPVAMIDPGGFFTLSRYPDVCAAFLDTQTYSSEGFRAVLEPEWVGRNPVADSLIVCDPPRHTQLRALANRAFVNKVLIALEQVMQACADELFGAPKVGAGEELDVVEELSQLFVGTVMAEALGLDRELVPRFVQWTNNITRLTPVAPEPEVIAEVKALIEEEVDYLSDVVRDRLASPREGDLPSSLCRAEIAGERLTEDELLSFMMILVGGGFETTIHLLSKATLLLAERSDLHAALRADPSLVPGFVDEMLRFDGPTHMLMRMTTRDVEVHGVTIPAHRPVGLMIGAANRDPSQFEDPDTFKLDRKPRGALAFGHGPHVCIGAALARIEGKVFLRELTRRFSRIELSSETRDWNLALHVRGLSTLPARLHV
ncbi:MAG: cytochrome P450 [Enhygromyxa sp.]